VSVGFLRCEPNWPGGGLTAVEGKSLGVLIGLLVGGIWGRVGDAGGLAGRGGEDNVVEVGEVSGGRGEEHVAVLAGDVNARHLKV
jgi:hypothetical protein